MAVSIQFCGGAKTVTGSVHLITTKHSKVILDCGLFQGKRDEYFAINSQFPFNPQNLDACVLSHAHIDHSGNIPTLVKKGFRASVYCTPVTRDLCRYMLPDSGHIQEEDIKYVNKINRRRGLPPRAPLYTKEDAEKALKYFRALDYDHTMRIADDVDLNFYDGGHILGSTITVLDIMTGSRQPIRIAYAVDLGREGMPLLDDPEVPPGINYLIMESTYGGRRHETLEEAEIKLANTINKTVQRGGKVIIPSFALERTQLIVYFISELIKRKMVPKIPIYVDGPLAVSLTQVFRENWKYFDEATKKSFREHKDPFSHDNIEYISKVDDSKKLHDIDKPIIIISASGMCENGRIQHHLKNNIENPKNAIIVVGFMAKDTLGRRIVEKQATVRIFGRPYDLRAEVVVINAFSSHADCDGLVEYAGKCRGNLRQIFLVHGEADQAEILKNNIRKKFRLKVSIPEKGEAVYLR
ncbi:MAG: MBL fold metallo-hydrolase [Candidatus Omnitrophica bacterium]|jgi:metallo-beta-lactamase family protein|nr:MBL fold metallo-hydrolase [Candidatus Omnitrophota bacterium]